MRASPRVSSSKRLTQSSVRVRHSLGPSVVPTSAAGLSCVAMGLAGPFRTVLRARAHRLGQRLQLHTVGKHGARFSLGKSRTTRSNENARLNEPLRLMPRRCRSFKSSARRSWGDALPTHSTVPPLWTRPMACCMVREWVMHLKAAETPVPPVCCETTATRSSDRGSTTTSTPIRVARLRRYSDGSDTMIFALA